MTAQTSAPQVELLPCPLCKKMLGTKVGPPALARCITDGCDGKKLGAVTLIEWNTRPSPDSVGVEALKTVRHKMARLKETECRRSGKLDEALLYGLYGAVERYLNALSIPPQASAGERGWTAPTLPPVPINWARPVGATFDEMRDNVWKSGLASKGDTILVWVNEGDFWHALMVCGGKEFAPPATLEPGRGK